MPESGIYRIQGPSKWPESPTQFSFSSLTTIEACPRQWQLVHAQYGSLVRFPARPNPAAVEGRIVHEALELLFKTLAIAGLPDLGTPAFKAEIARVDVGDQVRRLLDEHDLRLEAHPRTAGFRLRASPEQLINRVIRLFRAEYHGVAPSPADDSKRRPTRASGKLAGKEMLSILLSRGAITELALRHPSLPFAGFVDLVRTTNNGIEIIDFKTGRQKAEHQDQVLGYALLWWRITGQTPKRASVRYTSGADTRTIDVKLLTNHERRLRQRIEKTIATLSLAPATAHTGNHCLHCDVRQFCDRFWATAAKRVPKRTDKTRVDITLTVDGPPGPYGFSSKSLDGSICNVVHGADGPKVHGLFVEHENLRILNGKVIDGALELMPWTEVFHR